MGIKPAFVKKNAQNPNVFRCIQWLCHVNWAKSKAMKWLILPIRLDLKRFFASVLCENWAFWDKYRSIYAHEETESIRGKKSIKRKGLMSAGKQQKNKKCLTFHTIDDIVIKVVKTTHRKVGIHLTSARASDPGL